MREIATAMLIVLNITTRLSSQNVAARYNFSGNAMDIGGGGYDGIVHSATLTTDRFGNPDCAYLFDGINDYIEILYWTPFNFGLNDFAVSVWIKTTNSTVHGMILQKGSTHAYQAPQFWIRCPDPFHNMSLAFLTSNANPPSPYAATDTINIADGSWHHVVAQRNEKELELYYDCHLVATNEDTYRDVSDTIGIIIGAQHPHPDNSSIHNFFIGCIDDITIYDAALNYSEIQVLCNDYAMSAVGPVRKRAISIFPNPVDNLLLINGDFEQVEIYNLLGVKTKTYGSAKTFDLSDLVCGTYICKIYTGSDIIYRKIVIY
ncbi:MAG: T9SS type A sorting domain-containing protein [Bacteroidetes bacterium]|nr:T9SS type A sorting domain-containing protein [Bacteroidota bacterium]